MHGAVVVDVLDAVAVARALVERDGLVACDAGRQVEGRGPVGAELRSLVRGFAW